MENNLKLIDGSFNPDQAAEILYAVVNDKIKFHHHQNNANLERNVEDKLHSQKRLIELSIAKETIGEILQNARDQHADIEISADITLKIRHKASEETV